MPSFYNAKSGITKLFAAEILSLIATIVGLLSAPSSIENIDMTNKWVMFTMYLYVLFTTIFTILAYILIILGLKTAGKDHRLMKIAFFISIISLSTSFIVLVFQTLEILNIFNNTAVILTLGSIRDIGNSILQVLIVILVCLALNDLLKQRNEIKLAKKAITVVVMYSIYTFVGIIFNIIQGLGLTSTLISENTSTPIIIAVVVIGLSSLVLAVIASIKYIVLLGKAKNRLA